MSRLWVNFCTAILRTILSARRGYARLRCGATGMRSLSSCGTWPRKPARNSAAFPWKISPASGWSTSSTRWRKDDIITSEPEISASPSCGRSSSMSSAGCRRASTKPKGLPPFQGNAFRRLKCASWIATRSKRCSRLCPLPEHWHCEIGHCFSSCTIPAPASRRWRTCSARTSS